MNLFVGEGEIWGVKHKVVAFVVVGDVGEVGNVGDVADVGDVGDINGLNVGNPGVGSQGSLLANRFLLLMTKNSENNAFVIGL